MYSLHITTNKSSHHLVSSTYTTGDYFKTFFKEESKFLLYLQRDIYMGLTSEQLGENDAFIFKEIALN